MRSKHAFVVAVGIVAAVVVVAVGAAAPASSTDFTPLPAANPKTPGYAPATLLPRELRQAAVAQGSMALENGTPQVPSYGYDGDGPTVALPGTTLEAHKTEPDKNTYLVFPNGLPGGDASYDYGTHFLFQGHEGGAPGYITRINLDADGPHRVTLLAATDVDGKPLPDFDGSTWDPWAHRLLFTAEAGRNGGVWSADLSVPAHVTDISGAIGRGGYEGIQNDSDGNVWIVEDSGGAAGVNAPHAKQPNSFLYRFVPQSPGDEQHGRLQALQVISRRSGEPISFRAGQADADILSEDVADLHTYRKVFDTRWVTIHDTALDGNTPFDANALAKAAKATPFKRPENGQFKPGSHFTEFYFDETGDTNALTEAGAQHGGFGSILKLTQSSPSAATGKLALFYRSDVVHSGFDNVAFFSRDKIAFVEDAGDTLHAQRNALDSAYMFDVGVDYSNPANQPVRFMAQGRDASATLDSAAGGFGRNDGDNEITGIHVSDGDPGVHGILGDRTPQPFRPDGQWRVFYTQQHGDNVTYELLGSF